MSWILEENSQKIIEYIANKDKFTEKEIKRELKIKENEIRKILYILEELGIVYPIRVININNKYDSEWGNKIKDKNKIFQIIIYKELSKLEEEISKQQPYIFYCETCDIVYNIEQADEYEYKCPECGSILIEKENYKLYELNNIKSMLINLLNKYSSVKKRVSKSKNK